MGFFQDITKGKTGKSLENSGNETKEANKQASDRINKHTKDTDNQVYSDNVKTTEGGLFGSAAATVTSIAGVAIGTSLTVVANMVANSETIDAGTIIGQVGGEVAGTFLGDPAGSAIGSLITDMIHGGSDFEEEQTSNDATAGHSSDNTDEDSYFNNSNEEYDERDRVSSFLDDDSEAGEHHLDNVADFHSDVSEDTSNWFDSTSAFDSSHEHEIADEFDISDDGGIGSDGC
jgi:hypothetical protein